MEGRTGNVGRMSDSVNMSHTSLQRIRKHTCLQVLICAPDSIWKGTSCLYLLVIPSNSWDNTAKACIRVRSVQVACELDPAVNRAINMSLSIPLFNDLTKAARTVLYGDVATGRE